MTRGKKPSAIPKPAPSPPSDNGFSDDGVPIYTPPESESPTSLSPPSLEQRIDRIVNNVIDSMSRVALENTRAPLPTVLPDATRAKGKRHKPKKETPKANEEKSKPKQDTPKAKKDSAQAVAKEAIKKTRKTTVVNAWEDYFGNEGQLANWQRLCVDVGLEEVPGSITQCKKALKKVWVNIFDFLDAKTAGTEVKKFKSERELAKYTLKTGKIYPKKNAKEGGPARALLAHVFRG